MSLPETETPSHAPPAPGWSCPPGDLLAVLGERLAVVLPSSERGRAADLWARVDDGAGLGETLDALLDDGLSRLSDLVVVSREAARVVVVVRGSTLGVEVTTAAGTTEVVDGQDATTWVERSFEAVGSGRVVHHDRPGGPADQEPVVLASGLVRVSALSWGGGTEAPGAAAAGFAGSAGSGGSSVVAVEPSVGPDTEPHEGPEVVEEPEVVEGPGVVEGPEVVEAVEEPAVAEMERETPAPAPAAEPGGTRCADGGDRLPGPRA